MTTIPANIERVLMTPDSAQQLLDGRALNRPIRIKHVNRIKEDILSGRFNESIVAPIRINSEGKLTDGQHRMQAIVLANTPVWLFIEYTDASEFDLNEKRTPSDRLTFAGFSHAVRRASVVKVIIACERIRKLNGRWNFGMNPTGTVNSAVQICSRAEDLPNLTEDIQKAATLYKKQAKFERVFNERAAAAVLHFCREDTGDTAFFEEAVARIATSEFISSMDPAYAYRRFMGALDPKVRNPIEFPALMYVARAVFQGKQVTQIRSNTIGDVSKIAKEQKP